jgi:thiol-disulfide isomerase/thioredoxin
MFRTLVLLLALSAGTAFAALQAGDKAPTRLGLSRSGDSLQTTQYAGKVLVVTFWASWCAPCRAEMPMLEGLQRTVGKDKLEIVSLNIESRDEYKQVMRQIPPTTITIAHDVNKSTHNLYGVNGIPHLVVIDRTGTIVSVHRGYSEQAFEHIIADIHKAITAP